MTSKRLNPSRKHPEAAPRMRFALLLIGLLVMVVTALVWGGLRLPVGSSLQVDTINETLVGAEKAVLELDVGAGRLQLSAGASDQMLSGRIETLQGVETLTRTARPENGAMVYRLLSDAPDAVREPERWPEWTLQVNPDVPLELSVRGGTGPSELNLSELNVTNVVLEATNSRPTVIFPEKGHVNAVVEGGTSRTTLIIPSGVALKAALQVRGTGHIELNGQVYRRDATYTSPNFATADNLADNRLELAVTSRLAHVIIERR